MLSEKALEVLAVEWAVERISDQEIGDLQAQSDLMEFYVKRKDDQKVMEINADFHDVIYNAAGSRFMAQVLRSYKEYIEQTRKALFSEKRSLEEVYNEHKAILEAIKKRDVEGAKKAMAEHLDGSKEGSVRLQRKVVGRAAVAEDKKEISYRQFACRNLFFEYIIMKEGKLRVFCIRITFDKPIPERLRLLTSSRFLFRCKAVR